MSASDTKDARYPLGAEHAGLALVIGSVLFAAMALFAKGATREIPATEVSFARAGPLD